MLFVVVVAVVVAVVVDAVVVVAVVVFAFPYSFSARTSRLMCHDHASPLPFITYARASTKFHMDARRLRGYYAQDTPYNSRYCALNSVWFCPCLGRWAFAVVEKSKQKLLWRGFNSSTLHRNVRSFHGPI